VRARADFYWNLALSARSTLVAGNSFDCPESPEKGDPSTRELLRRADSTGPVSPTCNRFIRPKAGNAP